ncbi:hypothetical protein TNCV_743571 [Trichonephila clavipes]|nr:hypothetical protein TNCV_743571 [Trichonephila clavipes]
MRTKRLYTVCLETVVSKLKRADSEGENLRKAMNMKHLSRKEDFQMLPKELHQEKYKAINVPQDALRPVKKNKQEIVQHAVFRSTKDSKTTIT